MRAGEGSLGKQSHDCGVPPEVSQSPTRSSRAETAPAEAPAWAQVSRPHTSTLGHRLDRQRKAAASGVRGPPADQRPAPGSRLKDQSSPRPQPPLRPPTARRRLACLSQVSGAWSSRSHPLEAGELGGQHGGIGIFSSFPGARLFPSTRLTT